MFSNILLVVQARRNVATNSVVPFLDQILKHPFPLPGERFVIRCTTNSNILDGTTYLTRPKDDYSPTTDVKQLFIFIYNNL